MTWVVAALVGVVAVQALVGWVRAEVKVREQDKNLAHLSSENDRYYRLYKEEGLKRIDAQGEVERLTKQIGVLEHQLENES